MKLILGMQDWSNIQKLVSTTHHFNRVKKKNHIIAVNAEKALTEFNIHTCFQKTQKKNGKGLPQLVKEHLKKTPTANTILDGERLNALPLRSGTRHGCLFSSLCSI